MKTLSKNFQVITLNTVEDLTSITLRVLTGSDASKCLNFNTFFARRAVSTKEINICSVDLINYIDEIIEVIEHRLSLRMGSRHANDEVKL